MTIDEEALHVALKTYMRLAFNDDTSQRTILVWDLLKETIEAYEQAKISIAENQDLFDDFCYQCDQGE